MCDKSDRNIRRKKKEEKKKRDRIACNALLICGNSRGYVVTFTMSGAHHRTSSSANRCRRSSTKFVAQDRQPSYCSARYAARWNLGRCLNTLIAGHGIFREQA